MMITGHVPAVRLPSHHPGDHALRLSQRDEAWKTAEILILRHQLAVLQAGLPAASAQHQVYKIARPRRTAPLAAGS
jgi:hypothetical protein